MKRLLSLLLFSSLSNISYADFDSAKAAFESGDYETAVKQLLPLAKAGEARSQSNLGFMYQEGLGVPQDYAEAVKWYKRAVEQGDEFAINNLAWILATSADETIRNGFEAIRLIEAYLKAHNSNVYILDTLAAAYAEARRFEDAVTTQKKLLSMAKEDDPRLTEIQLHLKSYQDNKPWREN